MNIDQFITDHLPSGSGFNFKWEFIEECKNGTVIFETYYHNMNADGYYEGFTKVRLEIPRIVHNFRVKLSGGKQRYMDCDTRDYMWETIDNLLPTAWNWERDDCGDII